MHVATDFCENMIQNICYQMMTCASAQDFVNFMSPPPPPLVKKTDGTEKAVADSNLGGAFYVILTQEQVIIYPEVKFLTK